MEKTNVLSRRNLLRYAAVGTGIATIAAVPGTAEAIAPLCSDTTTPAQTEGPFYPIHDQLDKDNDLTKVKGSRRRAKGTVVYVIGHVLDQNCVPVAGARVEIWQACESGRYNHEDDPNKAPLDPDFQYYGRAVTDKLGRYIFRTIIPGAYPASADWVRPPHIHFKVAKLGYFELTTQMYFAGHKLNSRDKILLAIPPEERESVIVEFSKPTTNEYEPGSGVGRFDIVLKKV